MRKKARWFVRHPPRCFNINLVLPTFVSDSEGGIMHVGRYICLGCPARCPVSLDVNDTLPKKYRDHAFMLNEMYVKYATKYNAKNKTIKKENSK